MSSSRSRAKRTGRPCFLAPTAARADRGTERVSLPPKPPPRRFVYGKEEEGEEEDVLEEETERRPTWK